PPETKKSYHYALINDRLIVWIIALMIGLAGLGAIGTYGWVSLHRDITTNSQQVSTLTQQLTSDHLNSVEQQVQTISNDFTLVVKVLSQEVLFSKLLTKMAAAMPSGTSLTALNVSNTTGGSGLDITAEAANYTDAAQVQVNLSDPSNSIFSKSDIENINCNSGNIQNLVYPCTVKIRAQFATNNQFLFINQKGP
ncbi:hypothetical protein M1512_03030, partial [Patescibacteria group bacterium]|nr:hypothetical protein [Patescibacteria group bacterium]